MDISEVLADKGLNERALDCPCTPEHRNTIALCITHWKELAPFIDLSCTDEEEIDDPNRSAKEKNIALLRKWSQKRGNKATYLHLIRGFAKVERCDLIEKLCDIFTAGRGEGDEEGAHRAAGGGGRDAGMPAQRDDPSHLGTCSVCNACSKVWR